MINTPIATPTQPDRAAANDRSRAADAQLFPDIPQVRELTRAGLNLCPLPDAEGVRNVVALYRDAFGSAITEAEAEAVLARVMRFLWAINLPNSKLDASQTNDATTPPTTAQ